MSTPVAPTVIKVTCTLANHPYQISPDKIFVDQIEMHVPSTATGPAYFGRSTMTTDSIPRTTNTTRTFTASNGGDKFLGGSYFSLSDLYVMSATAGDIITFEYLERV